MAQATPRSRVQYIYKENEPLANHCGYCNADDNRFLAEGLWAHQMTAGDFQALVDRGCQRSGKFVYLPCNTITCCPQYVLRLDTETFRIAKQQRRVVRKFNECLCREEFRPPPDQLRVDQSPPSTASPPPKKPKKGVGPDPSKPPCRKAKLVRNERRQQKMAEKISQRSQNISESSDHTYHTASSSPTSMDSSKQLVTNLEEVLKLPDHTNHKLSMKLVCVNPPGEDYELTKDASYEVFRKFQMQIHKEPEEKCEMTHFYQFCVESPLILENGPPGMEVQYGSYHQQYWVDDTLVMVGVLDIIPQGVLCNYLYYDPEYRFMFPGVYSALCEINFTQRLHKTNPALQYYYMGFYVHDCPKMNYKRQYHSSFLLCPMTYQYVQLDVARNKLDKEKHCQFSSDNESLTPEAAEHTVVPVFNPLAGAVLRYGTFREMYGDQHDKTLQHYVAVFGSVTTNMVLMLMTL